MEKGQPGAARNTEGHHTRPYSFILQLPLFFYGRLTECVPETG
ncbi:MAG: hypothetical protein K0S39_974 [Paenibacillus sp.]|jgi:hypothetical protein|nr:hypothetical protein [Paenibacillus sp.]